jgi:hypothetical protein
MATYTEVMRRLLAVILILATGAFAQVQPVVPADAPHKACCCDHPGACGMPDCLPPPVASTALVTLERPAFTATAEVRRAAQPARRIGEKFFAAFVKPAAVSAAAWSSARVMSPAEVPLFKAHCSFLI